MISVSSTWLEHPAGEIPSEIEGLIFDCDGTLVDTMPTHFKAWTKAMTEVGIPFPEEQFYSFAGAPTVQIIKSLARQHGVNLVAEVIAQRKEQYFMELIPGVSIIELVVNIARREVGQRKIAVASGADSEVLHKLLGSVGLLKLFPVIVASDEVAHGKPAPDIFLEAARRMGVPPEKCAVYEDGEQGFLAAKAAGMPAIDVRPWYLPRRK